MGILKKEEKEKFFSFIGRQDFNAYDIMSILNISYSAAYHKIKYFESSGIIFKVGKKYRAA